MAPDPSTPNPRPFWYLVLTLFVIVWFAVLSQAVWQIPLIGRWLITLTVMLLFLGLAGREVNGRWQGVLIDSRYKLSLSRLQMTLWTILVLTAYLTIAIPRTLPGGLDKRTPAMTKECVQRAQEAAKESAGEGSQPAPDLPSCQELSPLGITFPPELLLAMGISAASFAGSNLVQSNKKSKHVNVQARQTEKDQAGARVATAAEAQRRAKESAKTQADLKQHYEAVLAQASAVIAANKALAAAPGDPSLQVKQQAAEAELMNARGKLQRLLHDLSGSAAPSPALTPILPDKLEGFAKDVQDQLKPIQQAYDEASIALGKIDNDLKTATEELQQITTKYENTQGLLHKNAAPSDARWADLVRGEEIANYNLIDLSKVQMLFFTIVVVFAYAVAIAGLLQDQQAMRHPLWVDFPPFSSTLNALLAISHGAYLSVKTVDQTKAT